MLTDTHGAVLDLGRSQRLASPAQRRALLARDGGCIIPGCPVPGGHCDVHHPTPWAHGGHTDLQNLVLTCPKHHSQLHDGDSHDSARTWRIEMIDGLPWVRPPAWVDPTQPLLRNTTHRPQG